MVVRIIDDDGGEHRCHRPDSDGIIAVRSVEAARDNVHTTEEPAAKRHKISAGQTHH